MSILTAWGEKVVYSDESLSTILIDAEVVYSHESMTRRTRFLLMVLTAAVVCLIASAGCVSEPPVPADGEYFVTIDPVPDQILGTTFVVSGTTNLPSGSLLICEQIWNERRNAIDDRYPPPGAGVFSVTGVVQKGVGHVNSWQYTINSSSYLYPKTYLLRIGVVNGNTSVTAETTYNITRSDGSMITPAPTPLSSSWPTRISSLPEPESTFVCPVPSPTLTPSTANICR